MSIQYFVLVLLLLSTILSVNAEPLAYVACTAACLSGCSVGTVVADAPLCFPPCQALCLPLLAASTP
ncbi:unnamed protein product [Rotaria sp. Silwood1]|nr:unnamed protein product [Rotaria sp. Silwood1]CAF0970719.1 unnamed protein product [Rotaria sp. Silwood1]